MNSFRPKINNQITNQNEDSGTLLFNKVSGIVIAISILLAVLETESHIEIQCGELIRKIDLVIGFCIVLNMTSLILNSSRKSPSQCYY